MNVFDLYIVPKQALPLLADRSESTLANRQELATSVVIFYGGLFRNLPDEAVPFEKRWEWLIQQMNEASKLGITSDKWYNVINEVLL